MPSKNIVAETGSGKTAEVLSDFLKLASTNAVTSAICNTNPEKPSSKQTSKNNSQF